MERIDYVKRGEIAYFIQDYNKFGKEEVVCYSVRGFDLEQFPNSVGAGKISRDPTGVLHIWDSPTLNLQINSGHLKKYIFQKKFSNVEIIR